ncbi:zinc finger and BTB domain-containing protein 5-like [Xenentodon cancila]
MDFPGHFQHIFNQLNQQRLHAQLCDCLVVVGGQTFQAHRSILAACSSHFRALLCSSEGAGDSAADRSGPDLMELDPEVVTPEAFSTLLDMIYTSTLSLGASNVMDVLLAASHLHLNTVVKACKLHLSRRNFPASAPKGWRSVQQQRRCPCSQQQVTSAMDEDLDKEDVVVEVSQSGGDKDSGVRTNEQTAAPSLRQKRESEEDRPDDRKRLCKLPGDNYWECSPSVTRSTEERDGRGGGEGLASPDCLKMTGSLWEHQVVDEVEKKHEAAKGESEEIQLPTQSDSSTGGVGVWEKGEDTDGDTVVKVKVAEEEGDETKMPVIEVKKENVLSYSPNIETNHSLLSLQDCTDNFNPQLSDQKMSTAGHAGDDGGSLQSSLCTDLHTDTQRPAGDLAEDTVDGEGLDSFSELAFSCFLNPSSESVMGALEEEDSLASLTAAATAAAAAATSDTPTACGDGDLDSEKSEEGCTSSAQSSDPSSSLVFPVTSVPLQQILPPHSPGFSDTIILQPTQNPLAGFLSGIRPGLSLNASLVQPLKTGKSSGTTTFRRIAPKVPPGSEPGADASSGSAGDGTDRPTLTRASEDVLSKCKKAAAEDHVLLVEGEKKYACKICCKTFMNLTDCKKHIRVHTGEKPYPCQKCGKRFSQSSHLYKHSKNTCISWKDGQSFPDSLL